MDACACHAVLGSTADDVYVTEVCERVRKCEAPRDTSHLMEVEVSIEIVSSSGYWLLREATVLPHGLAWYIRYARMNHVGCSILWCARSTHVACVRCTVFLIIEETRVCLI